MAILIAVLLLAFADTGVARESIESAFGQRLGANFDPASATSIDEMLFSREKAYSFDPAEAYADLETYYVLLTPITHRIYGIWAQAKMTSSDVCHREQDVLMTILRKKYGPSNNPDKELKNCWFFCFRTISIKQGPRSVETTCNTDLILRYTDHNLEKVKEREYEELDKGQEALDRKMKQRQIEQATTSRNTKGF
jgi:hypothetical protein